MLKYATISKTREKRGMSQKKLSELTGIRPDIISRLENGKQMNPTLRTLELVAAALELKISDLVNESIVTE